MTSQEIFVNSMWFGKFRRPKVLEAVCALSPEAQIALHQTFWRRAGKMEIAMQLKTSIADVERIIADALKQLRKMLHEDRNHLMDFAA